MTSVTSTESQGSNDAPPLYDPSGFDGNYDYIDSDDPNYQKHWDFGAFGAIVKSVRDYVSFATIDRCQKDIAYKIPLYIYCGRVANLESKCFEQSLLEIWSYDEKSINKLTQEDIIWAINTYDRSPYFGYAFNYSTLLGGVKRNSTNHIISATSSMYNFLTTVDLNQIVSSSNTKNAGTEFFPLDKENLLWQKEIINVSYKNNAL